jgi:thiol:disulfide interchange protein
VENTCCISPSRILFRALTRCFRTLTLQVIGDASPDASKLMKREGVRSVPSFHYFVGGEKVEVVNGANAEAIEAAITKHAAK